MAARVAAASVPLPVFRIVFVPIARLRSMSGVGNRDMWLHVEHASL